MTQDRRQFLKTAGLVTTLSAGGLSFPVMLGAPAMGQGLRRERWMAPSRITLLQSYVFVAQEKGMFRRQGLDVQIQQSGGTAASVTQVAAGTVTFGQAAPISTAPAIANEGLNVITIGQISYQGFFEIASLPGRPMRHPRDWQGRTIGVMSMGGTTDRLLDAMSIAAGLDPRRVNKVVTGLGASGVAFLQRGQVDGFFVFYETKVGLQMQGIDLHYLHADSFAKLPGDAAIVSTRIANDPAAQDMLVGYLRACREAVAFVADPANEAEVLRLLTIYNPTEGEQVDKNRRILAMIRDYQTPPAGVASVAMSDADWASGLDMMRRIDLITNKDVPNDRFYTNRFADRI